MFPQLAQSAKIYIYLLDSCALVLSRQCTVPYKSFADKTEGMIIHQNHDVKMGSYAFFKF